MGGEACLNPDAVSGDEMLKQLLIHTLKFLEGCVLFCFLIMLTVNFHAPFADRRDDMYYVLQVAPGTETKTETHISNILSQDLYGECFHPTRHMRKKFHGSWKDIHEKLLPGYVFITTDDIRKLYIELQKIPMLTKLLGKEDEYYAQLKGRDAEWLERLMDRNGSGGEAGQQHEVSLSQVSVDEGSGVRVVSGRL